MKPAMMWLIWATKGASFGAAVFQVLEFFHDFIDEVEYIWRGRIRLISYLYAWSRYLPLILQIVNLVFSEMVYATPSYRMCMASNILKGASAQLTSTCVEAIQMIRVHALYNCSHRSGKVLLWVFMVGTTLEVLGTVAVIGHVKPGVTGSLCIPAHCSLRSLSLFLVGWGLIQGVLLFMTVSKIVLFRSANCIRTPIISLMLRDGISFFVIITVVITSIIGFEVVRGLNETVFVWNVAFSWYICLLSVAGCRMILSIRKLGDTRHSRNQRTVYDPTLTQFSTIIDIAEISIAETT